jgi:hypothetical protein
MASPGTFHAAVQVSHAPTPMEPESKVLLYTYHRPSEPIKSVYQHEQEAKARGIIKEMTLIPPIPPIIEEPQRSPKSIKKRRASQSPQTKYAAISQQNAHFARDETRSGVITLKLSPRLMATISKTELPSPRDQPAKEKKPVEIREEDLFSESDDELAQKLMKDVMPGNYLQMRKRRGDLSSMTKQLNSSTDLSLRAA